MIRILIIDDHPLVIEGIQTSVAGEPDMTVVGSAASGHKALHWLEQNQVEVIILDISLPDMDGISLCKKIRNRFSTTSIIGLTTYEEVSFIRELLKEGARGYLFKTSSRTEILRAIRAVAAGEQYLSPGVNEKLVAAALRSPTKPGLIPKLTRREKEVLGLIMDEFTNQEIAEKLFISQSTVETHRRHLCEKLGARNTAGLVRNAIKFGLN